MGSGEERPRARFPPACLGPAGSPPRRPSSVNSAEMHDVPLAPPRNERFDVERLRQPGDLVTEPRAEDTKVADLVILLARLDPSRAAIGHIEAQKLDGAGVAM